MPARISSNDGVQLQLFHWDQGANQCWQIEQVPPIQSTFKIRCVDGGLALENALFQWNYDASKIPQNVPTNQQSPVQTNPLGLGLNQVWVLENNGNNQFKIRSIVNNLVWAIPPDQINQNAFPFLDNDGSNLSQLWIFQDLSGRQGPYKIIPAATTTNRVLDMQNGSHQPGIFVQQYAPAHGHENQQWLVEPFSY